MSRRAVLPLLAAALLLAGCGREHQRPVYEVAGGDPARAPALMRAYGCHACHSVPGVAGADKFVGPPLAHWSRRTYIAGYLPNTPQNLVAWIQDPQRFRPGTAMPATGITEQEARDVAAYLFSLR